MGLVLFLFPGWLLISSELFVCRRKFTSSVLLWEMPSLRHYINNHTRMCAHTLTAYTHTQTHIHACTCVCLHVYTHIIFLQRVILLSEVPNRNLYYCSYKEQAALGYKTFSNLFFFLQKGFACWLIPTIFITYHQATAKARFLIKLWKLHAAQWGWIHLHL